MSNQVPERVSISTSILQEILNYLSNQRFSEVSTLIRAIEGDVTAVEPKLAEKMPVEEESEEKPA